MVDRGREGRRSDDPQRGLMRGSDVFERSDANLQRMLDGKPPIGTDGKPVQLHHRGQYKNYRLDEYTDTEHHKLPLHERDRDSEIDRRAFDGQRKRYWRTRAREILRAAARKLSGSAFPFATGTSAGYRRRSKAILFVTAALGARVWFHHPLVRSAVYRAASPAERQSVHRLLAEVTDPETDPDRRAWHRAAATSGPDDDVADELERSASRARARGGLAAAAAFLERSAALTRDPRLRPERLLAAAQAKYQAGALEAARALLASAESGRLDDLQRAEAERLQAQIAFALSQGRDVPPLLLKAAQRLEPLDASRARETYLDALAAAIFVGHLAGGAGAPHVAAAAARAAPPPADPSRAPDLLLDGLALLFTDGYVASVPTLKRALSAFRSEELAPADALRWLWLAGYVATFLWDDESWHALSARQLRLARGAGALSVLPMALAAEIGVQVHAGDLATAASLIEELETLTEAIGLPLTPYGALALAAWRGREAPARRLMDAITAEVTARSEGMGLNVVHWAKAVLYNGLGRYGDALEAALRGSATGEFGPAVGATPLDRQSATRGFSQRARSPRQYAALPDQLAQSTD